MSSSIEDAIHGAEDATTQIARLRAQVESLMRDRVTPAVADVAGRAEIALRTASDKVREQAETVSGKVREQPLLAVLIAAAVGFVLGRVTSSLRPIAAEDLVPQSSRSLAMRLAGQNGGRPARRRLRA